MKVVKCGYVISLIKQHKHECFKGSFKIKLMFSSVQADVNVHFSIEGLNRPKPWQGKET